MTAEKELELDPVETFWNKSSFKIKSLYEENLIDRSHNPKLKYNVIPEKENMFLFFFEIELRNNVDGKICKLGIPYYKISGARIAASTKINKTLNKHLTDDSEFMVAVKYVFNYLNVSEIDLMDPHDGKTRTIMTAY